MKDEQEIDKLFRRGLTDAANEPHFREADWDNLEQLLDGNKRRRGIVYWLPAISSVAAMLLLVLGWWLYKPQQTDNSQKSKPMAVTGKKANTPNPGTDSALSTSNSTAMARNNMPAAGTDATGNIAVAAPTANNNKIAPAGIQDSYAHNLPTQKGNAPTRKAHIYVAKDGTVNIKLWPDNNIATATGVDVNKTELMAHNTMAINSNNTVNDLLINDAKPSTHQLDNTAYLKYLANKRDKEVITKSSLKHPIFAVSVMGAPEINGVNSFSEGQTGVSGALLFSVNMNKFTITTGIGYAKKPYYTSFENYHSTGYTFKTFPTDVIADCRALDIPLNIDYMVFNRRQNKISLGTGISSYLMMHENYRYEYDNPTARGPRSYTIANPGKYLFGVLNLQATYQRQINSKFGINVQPYFKLPLTNIGASQVKLQSAGVAVGVSWNINSLTKP